MLQGERGEVEVAETRTLTPRGARTRRRLLDSGEKVFGRVGYHDATIADITGGAGVALGTFYLYFDSKLALLRDLIDQRGHEMRAAMAEASASAAGRLEQERAGFVAFFTWMAHHRGLYRIVRQAEFADPELFQSWYRSIAASYVRGLRAAARSGEIAPLDDLETVAYCLMGIGDFVGMRWLVIEGRGQVPRRAIETATRVVQRALAP